MQIVTGIPIQEDSKSLVMQEGNAVAKYCRKFYRLADEPDFPKAKLQLTGAWHAIGVPREEVNLN